MIFVLSFVILAVGPRPCVDKAAKNPRSTTVPPLFLRELRGEVRENVGQFEAVTVPPAIGVLIRTRKFSGTWFRRCRRNEIGAWKGVSPSRAVFMLGIPRARYAFLLAWCHHYSWRDHRIR